MEYGIDYWYEEQKGATPVLPRGEPIEEPDSWIERLRFRGMMEQKRALVMAKRRMRAEQKYFLSLMDV